MSRTTTVSPFYLDENITVTATSYSYTQSTSFVLRIKNPCIDPSFNAITVPSAKESTYIVNGELMEIQFTTDYAVQL